MNATNHTHQDHLDAARRLNVVQQARGLRAAGLGWQAIGEQLGVPYVNVWRWCERVAKIEHLCAENFLARRPAKTSAPKLTAAEAAAIKSLNLLSNRTAEAGSAPEATRRAMSEGLLRPELAAELAAREAAGLPILTPAQRNAVRVGESTVRSFRNGREAWLDYVQSPGSLMLEVDLETGVERYLEPGEKWTIDDGTINFVCCVPTGDPSYKHGVMAGRFQFLLVVDHRSYFIPGFSYTARPRGSYRAEDLVATIHNTVREHGVPRRMVLEKGISAAEVVTHALGLLGVQIERANSPHQKVVEMVFSNLWTKLSFMPGQVGRFQGEEAEVSAILQSCRDGAKDPRKYFPLLADVLAALRLAIEAWNQHWVNGSRYGRWQPAEFWQRKAHEHLRRLAESDAWMCAPHVAGPLTVRGAQIGTSVLLMPGFSQKFTFAAPWLHEWIGALVRLHWNPFAQDSQAKCVLAADFSGARDGLVLGDLDMIDRQARHTRRQWGYSSEDDIGLQATRRNAQALHRSAVAIRPDGKPGVATVQARDGLGSAVEVSTSTAAAVPEPSADLPARTPRAPRRDLREFADAEGLLGDCDRTASPRQPVCAPEEFAAESLL